MRVFDVRASYPPLGYLCAKFRSFEAPIAQLARGEKSRTQSLTHSPSLFDDPGTEASLRKNTRYVGGRSFKVIGFGTNQTGVYAFTARNVCYIQQTGHIRQGVLFSDGLISMKFNLPVI